MKDSGQAIMQLIKLTIYLVNPLVDVTSLAEYLNIQNVR